MAEYILLIGLVVLLVIVLLVQFGGEVSNFVDRVGGWIAGDPPGMAGGAPPPTPTPKPTPSPTPDKWAGPWCSYLQIPSGQTFEARTLNLTPSGSGDYIVNGDPDRRWKPTGPNTIEIIQGGSIIYRGVRQPNGSFPIGGSVTAGVMIQLMARPGAC